MRAKALPLLIAVGLALWGVAHAADFGFLDSNIWFSKSNFFSGDTIRIYSAIFNRGDADAAGTVEFFDNDLKIGSAEFAGVKSGALKEVRIDWQATEGNHVFSANIVGSTEKTGTNARFIDTDTDHDGVGNTVDTDDDGDGMLDVNDAEPLVPGAPAKAQNSVLPAGTASTVAGVANVVDSFAAGTSANLKEVKVSLEKDIRELKQKETATQQTDGGKRINEAVGDDSFVVPTKATGTPSETLKRIGKQLLLLLVNIGIYILEHKPLLYITIVVLAFFVLRLLWRMFGRQQF